MTITITLQDAVELFDKALADRGVEYVYAKGPVLESTEVGAWFLIGYGCVYVEPVLTLGEDFNQRINLADTELKASCAVGEVFHRAGVPLQDMVMSGSGGIEDLLLLLADNGTDVSLTPEARVFLRALQEHQDHGTEWVEARRIALNNTFMMHGTDISIY